MDAALSPLRQMGIRILNYLDDWLILAQSEVELLSHRTLLLSHLERLWLRVNFAKSALSPSQRVSFLGTVLDSARMRAVIAPERTLAIQKLAATFKSSTARPLKAFQRMLGLVAAASPVLQLGLLPSTLVETTGSTFTFTFMHLADAFIQSDLHCIQVTVLHFISSCFPWESNPWSWRC